MSTYIDSFNTFRCVGELQYKKDNFYTVHESSTWEVAKLRFKIKCNETYVNLEIVGMKPKNESVEISYFTKEKENNYYRVKFSDRNKVDTEALSYRHSVIKTPDRTFRFVSDYDFVQKTKSMLESGYCIGKKMVVSGSVRYDAYYGKDGNIRELTKYTPNRIEVANENEHEKATTNLNLYLADGCFFKRGDNGILKGYAVVRNSKKDNGKIKGYEGFKVEVNVDLGDIDKEKAFDYLADKYVGNDKEMNRIGLYADIVNEARDIELTDDMLTDEERTELKLGISTMSDIVRRRGKGKSEVIKGLFMTRETKGYENGVIKSDVSLEDLELYIKQKSVPVADVFSKSEVAETPKVETGNNPFEEVETSSNQKFSAISDDDLPF